jgi:hypothetical protein
MGSVTEVQEGMLENVDAPMGTPVPATTVGSPHGGEDTESTKAVEENAGQPPKRELPESSVPEEDSVPTKETEGGPFGADPRFISESGRRFLSDWRGTPIS